MYFSYKKETPPSQKRGREEKNTKGMEVSGLEPLTSAMRKRVHSLSAFTATIIHTFPPEHTGQLVPW